MSEKRSNLIDVGRIAGAFGVKGWLKVVSDTEPAENIVNYSPWWLKTAHGVKPFELIDHKFNSNGLLVLLDGIEDRDQAAQYRATKIAIEKTQLAALQAGEYYWHQLIGLDVVSDFGGRESYLGAVKEIIETGANDVLVVDPAERKAGAVQAERSTEAVSKGEPESESVESKQRLIPYIPDTYVLSIDLDLGEMRVNWDPEF